MSTDSAAAPAGVADAPRRGARPAFVAMMAFVYAVVAFSIDAMLPALPQIAAEMVPQDVNRAQLVLTAFMLGMGGGMLFSGPISDAVGRKRTIAGGIAIYVAGAALAITANSLEVLLLARVLQGIGASGPRIAVLAMIRDVFQGREMARVMSFVNMLFLMVPAIAPFAGQMIMHVTGWRGIFGACILFAVAAVLWIGLGQRETLPPARRVPLQWRRLLTGAREALSNRQVQICTVTIALGFGQMFALLSSAPQLFAETYGRGAQFAAWFAILAVLAAGGTMINARLVMRVGMRRMASTAYAVQVVLAGLFLVLLLSDALPQALRFPAFFLWAISIFIMAGVTFGNLNAMALQGMGHIAGLTASLVSAFSTVGAMLVAAPVGQLYNGTAVPVATAAMLCSGLAWLLMRGLPRSAG